MVIKVKSSHNETQRPLLLSQRENSLKSAKQ